MKMKMKILIYENHPKLSSEHQEFGPTDHSTSVTWRAGWPHQCLRHQFLRKVQRRPSAPPLTRSGLYTTARRLATYSEPACVCSCLPDWTTISTRYKRRANHNVSVLKKGSWMKKEIMGGLNVKMIPQMHWMDRILKGPDTVLCRS